MPRVRVKIPDELLQRAATRAAQLGVKIDDLYGQAIERYLEVNANASPGSLRSRSGIPSGSPLLTIEVDEAVFERADVLAKRLGKRRDVLYAEALARHVQHAPVGDSALGQGHDLPSGAWRSSGGGS